MSQQNPQFYMARAQSGLTSINKKYLTFASTRCFSLMETIDNRPGETPSLILIEASGYREQANDFAVALRRRADKLADIPLIAIASTDPDAGPSGPIFDAHVDATIDGSDIARLIQRWRFVDNDSLPRLTATFGPSDIRALIAKLRLMLVESLGQIHAGRTGDIAHRVIGACGTLGYSDASRVWLGDPGDPDVIDDIKVVTRKTIYQIACDLERLAAED